MISFVIVLFSCKNDIQDVTSLSLVDSLPLETAYDIVLYFSDSGKVQAYLESPLMKRFEGKENMIEFPDGFKIIMYDSAKQVKSQITAKYGINYEKKKMLEARNDVIVINKKKHEQLNTEHLVWDQRKKIIFSDVFVKITTPDNVLYGDSLISDQNFDDYTISNVTGEISLTPDKK